MQNKTYKIVHIISGLNTGGAERALTNLVRNHSVKTDNILVISMKDKGTYGPEIESMGIKVETLELKGSLPTIKSLRKLSHVYKEFQPDIIQGWMYHGNLAALCMHFLARRNSSLVWNIRHSLYTINNEKILTRIVIRINKLFSNIPTKIIFNSKLSIQQHADYGFFNSSSQLIPNGFDLETFKPDSSKRKKMRNRLKLNDDLFCIGHIARNHPMKNQSGFINAAVKIAATREDCVFLMCGTEVNDDNSELTELIPEEFKNRFLLIGESKDIPQVMSTLDALCLCSLWGEAFPNVLGEAMASGVPCISADIGDSKNIVGKSGIIFEAGDQQGLEKAISTMLELPKNEVFEMRISARERISHLFSSTKVMNQYHLLYQNLSG